MEEINYEIEHRPRFRMKHDDALSKRPVMLVSETRASELIYQLRKLQEDDYLKLVTTVLEEQGPYKDHVTK